MNWHMAQRFCKSSNRRLVEIDTEIKQKDILNIIEKFKARNAFKRNPDFWIGITSYGIKLGAVETHYYASSGRYVNVTTYNNFDSEIFTSNQCVVLKENIHDEIVWHDAFCSDEKYFMCENDGDQENRVNRVLEKTCSVTSDSLELNEYLSIRNLIIMLSTIIIHNRLN